MAAVCAHRHGSRRARTPCYIYSQRACLLYTMPAHPLPSSVLSMGSAVGSHFVLIKHTNGGGKKIRTLDYLKSSRISVHYICIYTLVAHAHEHRYYICVHTHTYTHTPTSCKTDACTLVVWGFWLSLRTLSWRPFWPRRMVKKKQKTKKLMIYVHAPASTIMKTTMTTARLDGGIPCCYNNILYNIYILPTYYYRGV